MISLLTILKTGIKDFIQQKLNKKCNREGILTDNVI